MALASLEKMGGSTGIHKSHTMVSQLTEGLWAPITQDLDVREHPQLQQTPDAQISSMLTQLKANHRSSRPDIHPDGSMTWPLCPSA